MRRHLCFWLILVIGAELARFLYPEQMDDLAAYQRDDLATRRDFANIGMWAWHVPVFVPSSSKYYETTTKGHIYGLFADVPWTNADFDAVEAAVQAGYTTWREVEDGTQWYDVDAPVTREELARTVVVIGDFEGMQAHTAIADIDLCEKLRVVQMMVDNGVFDLAEGRFEPQRQVTCREIIDALAHIAP